MLICEPEWTTLCGGSAAGHGETDITGSTCVRLDVSSCSWQTCGTLQQTRHRAALFQQSPANSSIILGGSGLFQSTETVPADCQSNTSTSTTSSSTSTLAFNLSSVDVFDACAITLQGQPSSVYLTGGSDRLDTVEVYDNTGLLGPGPSLNEGRRGHGCTSYQLSGTTVSLSLVELLHYCALIGQELHSLACASNLIQ